MEIIHLDHQILKEEMAHAFSSKNVCEPAVHHAASCIIQTSLRGVDSHGIHLFPHYCRAVDAGRINNNPPFTFTQTAPSVGYIDAIDAFGSHEEPAVLIMGLRTEGGEQSR